VHWWLLIHSGPLFPLTAKLAAPLPKQESPYPLFLQSSQWLVDNHDFQPSELLHRDS
jgi:hypothetical protein